MANLGSGTESPWPLKGHKSRRGHRQTLLLDMRLECVFTHLGSGKDVEVPGYYAADGNAGETGASDGKIWRCLSSPRTRRVNGCIKRRSTPVATSPWPVVQARPTPCH